MNAKASQSLKSRYADQRQSGFPTLRFSAFVEEEFRSTYCASSIQRARLLPIIGIIVLLINTGRLLALDESPAGAVAFNIGVMLPTLALALWASTDPARHRLFQLLLAASAFLLGMWATSIVTRASMSGASYYSGAQVAWIFIVWLMLGLPFRHAALVSLTISAMAIFGNSFWYLPPAEATFVTTMLLVTNVLGAVGCYQLEHAVRQSFLESRVFGELAERDGLTGLYNRRSFDEYLERIWRQSRREQQQLTLMLIDIDYFKSFNDLNGHQAGDDALKAVADVIKLSAQRPLDFAARFGGDEFALVLFGPAEEYGRELPEQVREAVRDLKIVHEGSSSDHYLTVSIGVAIVHPDANRSIEGAIQMADEALYDAKEAGRNRVKVNAPDANIQTGRFRANRRTAS